MAGRPDPVNRTQLAILKALAGIDAPATATDVAAHVRPLDLPHGLNRLAHSTVKRNLNALESVFVTEGRRRPGWSALVRHAGTGTRGATLYELTDNGRAVLEQMADTP